MFEDRAGARADLAGDQRDGGQLLRLDRRDQPVIDFLAGEPEVRRMRDDISRFVGNWLPAYIRDNRNYLTVGIGCTGGQHRSVYLAETLAARLRETGETVLLRHRELDR